MSEPSIEEIKESINLVEVVSDSVDLHLTSETEGKALCPFHLENTPSFKVYKDRYYCFGCHAKGDVVDWYVNHLGFTFKEALEELGVGRRQGRRAIKETVKYSVHLSEDRLKIIKINAHCQGYFQDWLQESKKAQQYLMERGVDFELAKRWGLGFCPYSKQDFSNLGLDADDLDLAGITFRNSKEDIRFSNRITIPLKNQRGDILGFTGRSITKKLDPKYLDPVSGPAFKKSQYLFGWVTMEDVLIDEKWPYIVIVEGLFDAIRMDSIGIKNVLSVMGSTITKEQVNYLDTLSDKKIIMMDGDMPGLESLTKIKGTLGDDHQSYWAYLLSHGEDPDSRASKHVDSKDFFKGLPLVPLSVFSGESLHLSLLNMEYDRSKLDELIKPYVESNIKEGFPHYNVVDWVIQAWPKYAPEIKEAVLKMVRDVDEVDGKRVFKTENVKQFIAAWIKPCREVRLKHKKYEGKKK